MYLVTGGAGFIGSHIVDALVRRGDRVRVLDDFSSGDIAHLSESRSAIELIDGDVRDPETVRRALDGVTYVCHQAALRSVVRSVDDPLSSDAVNTHGTLQLLVTAREVGTVQRIVYASSSSVYGDAPALPKREDQVPAPISPYAVSKLAGEHYCRTFTHLYGLATVSLRYFNVFGPRQSPTSRYATVVPLFIRAALRGEPLTIHGDGLQSRDFTYVDNVVQANLLAFEASDVAGEVFNVACDARYTVLDIARSIEGLIGRPLVLQHTAPRSGDVRHTQADIDKARRRLRYEPTVGFDDGMRRTFDVLRREIEASAESGSIVAAAVRHEN